jgi:hypothetical protein
MKKLAIILLSVFIIFLTGCTPSVPNQPKKTPTPTLTPTPTITNTPTPTESIPTSIVQYVISPLVTLNDNANYKVESVNIGKISTTSSWVYGIVKIRYLGTVSLKYISVDATFKNSSNSTLFTDFSFFYNVTVRKYLASNTDTFFTSTYNEGYYMIIENLNNYGIQLTDITNISLEINGQVNAYAAPYGLLSPVGTPAYQTSDDSWKLNVINNGDQKIESLSTVFVYKDSGNRMYIWSYPLCYVGDVSGHIFDINQTGYLIDTHVTPDYLASHLDFGDTLLNWLPYIETASIKSEFGSIVENNNISTDEKNKLMRKQIDELTREKSNMK